MTSEDIIALAHEAGTLFATECGVASATPEWIERFGALVAAAEREACAAICDAKSEHWWARWKHQADLRDMGASDGADECAQAIRSRT